MSIPKEPTVVHIYNTESYELFWLPDGIHQYERSVWGTMEETRIIDANTGSVKSKMKISIFHPKYAYLSGLSRVLAYERYRRRRWTTRHSQNSN